MSLDVYLHGPENDTLYSANITHNLGGIASEAGLYLALWRPGQLLDPQASDRIEAAEHEGRYDVAGDLEKLLPTPLAAHLIEPLRAGLALLRSDSARFEKLAPTNGWGTYHGLVVFVTNYLAACEENPTATVRVSR